MMLYPVYIHVGDDTHAHGVTIPDFPGCFSAADRWDDLPRMIQEAAELYFEDEDVAVPSPTPFEELVKTPDYQGGIWMLVDIDIAKLKVRARRVNVTIPDNVLKQIDDFVGKHNLTRSGLLADAALQYINSYANGRDSDKELQEKKQ